MVWGMMLPILKKLKKKHCRGFSIEQPLEEALSVSVTAKPTASERAPQWTKGSGGGVGG